MIQLHKKVPGMFFDLEAPSMRNFIIRFGWEQMLSNLLEKQFSQLTFVKFHLIAYWQRLARLGFLSTSRL